MPDDHPSPWKRFLLRSAELETWIDGKSTGYRVALTLAVCVGIVLVVSAIAAMLGE